MKNIKDELQHIILGDEPAGKASQLKKVQCFLRRSAQASFTNQKRQRLKSEEAATLLAFAKQEDIIYTTEIPEIDFISEGKFVGAVRKSNTYQRCHECPTSWGWGDTLAPRVRPVF